MIYIAIAGGIGSGKSMIAQLLRVMNYPVYDTDSRARQLMNESQPIKRLLIEAFGSSTYENHKLNRNYLSTIVFKDSAALKKLNAIVHPAVKQDFENWAQKQKSHIVFFETALLYESHMDSIAQEIWKIDAPIGMRIERVKRRNAMQEDDIKRRMAAQTEELRPNEKDRLIINDNSNALMPQVIELIRQL